MLFFLCFKYGMAWKSEELLSKYLKKGSVLWLFLNYVLMKIKGKDTQDMPKSRNTAFPKYRKKERLGAHNDQIKATYDPQRSAMYS